MSDDAKKAILARRAKFVAAALAGGFAACEPKAPEPVVCLTPLAIPDEDASTPLAADAGARITPDTVPPTVCLSPVPPPREDAGEDDSDAFAPPPPPRDAGGPRVRDAGVQPPKPPPRPCLSPPPIKPTVCLSVYPTKYEDKGK